MSNDHYRDEYRPGWFGLTLAAFCFAVAIVDASVERAWRWIWRRG